MKRVWLLSVVATTSIAATSNAQVAPAKPDSTCTNYPDGRVECRVFSGGTPGDPALQDRMFYRMDSAMAKRAALGLELRPTGTRRDTLGIFVEAVTPRGPAENAGIIEGDRIAAINGIDVRASAADTDDPYTNGLASHRLGREVQKLTPGSRVTLRVYSGGRFRDVQVTAGKASDVMRLSNHFNFRVPGPDGMLEMGGPGAMMFGPRMPMTRERMEPLLREHMEGLPRRIQIRTPMRIRTVAPLRSPRIYKVDQGGAGGQVWAAQLDDPAAFPDESDFPEFGSPMFFDFDEEPLEFRDDIEPVSPDEIRELAATTIRDARSALAQLAADGIA